NCDLYKVLMLKQIRLLVLLGVSDGSKGVGVAIVELQGHHIQRGDEKPSFLGIDRTCEIPRARDAEIVADSGRRLDDGFLHDGLPEVPAGFPAAEPDRQGAGIEAEGISGFGSLGRNRQLLESNVQFL